MEAIEPCIVAAVAAAVALLLDSVVAAVAVAAAVSLCSPCTAAADNVAAVAQKLVVYYWAENSHKREVQVVGLVALKETHDAAAEAWRRVYSEAGHSHMRRIVAEAWQVDTAVVAQKIVYSEAVNSYKLEVHDVGLVAME